MKAIWNKATQSETNPTYTGVAELVASENGLIGYSTAIVDKFYLRLGLNSDLSVLEFGAGTGFLAEILRAKYKVKPICVELDPNLCKVIRNKDFKAFQYLNELSVEFDSIYTSNVLEHIENDLLVLKELKSHLKPGGKIGIYVPAHPMLFSKMDETVGHIRRYRKSELVDKAKEAGFEIKSVQYDDFIGFFASLAVKYLGYGSKGLGSTKSLKLYDSIIYPISAILDSIGFRKLLGKNLLLICENSE